MWEEGWRIDEGTIRVGENDSGREDLIGIRSTNIESRIEERIGISIEAAIDLQDTLGRPTTEWTEVASRSQWASCGCEIPNGDIDSGKMSDARCWIARYTGIEENIAILHDERPTRIRIIRIIDGITSDNEISSLKDRKSVV